MSRLGGSEMPVIAGCTKCDYREEVPDQIEGMEALRHGGELARAHALTEHFTLVSPIDEIRR